MRVMIVISSCGVGGTQRVAMHLADWLASRCGCSCHVVSLRKPEAEAFDMSGYHYTELMPGKTVSQLKKLIRKETPDIVLSMGVPMSIYTVPACLFTRTKHIISERNDPAHFAGKTTIRILSRLVMKAANGYVFQTNEARNFYGGRIAKKSVVIPNPLFDMENVPDKPYPGERKKTVVSVGRLNRQKNQKMLIQAFAEISDEFPEYSLTIWGEGPERADLEAKIRDLGMTEKIHLPGATGNVLREIYDEGAFVLCSDFEGIPNALMEAMALGLPCISTDCPCGGPKEIIEDGENGFLIPTNDVSALKNKLRMLLNDRPLAERMGSKAIRIREKFDLNTICREWYQYFKAIIKSPD